MTRTAVIIEPGYADYSHERDILGRLGLGLKPVDGAGDRTALKSALSEAEIVFVRDTVLDAELIDAMTQAKGIVRYGIGVDTIDLDAAKAKGLVVARVNDYGADIEVADHTVALLLAAQRRIVSRDRDVRAGAWQVGQKEPIRRIAGSTMGFLGFGRIARSVAERMSGFGVTDFIAHDPYLGDAPDGVRLVSLEELAAQADLLSLHAPATDANRGIIGAEFLSRMKPHAILVNTARGPLIDETALHKALEEERLRGAALDVFAIEPPVGNPLLSLDRVVISDHSAWYSEATVAAIQSGAAREAKLILETGDAEHRIV
ncbi:C-terminal binding protein [Paracoccus homiensis]|uniref:D-3-phosphoglycerate dehydrogenase n=1 Tax=Paracoccus homiensis TaxID=364199 RepID=A0A1I0IJR6_9RHOB|nr:C-terminal binding protein [Paracoccus homiensis]SET97304.1 D-3-phosphoglycerate dehydrogenase [Paracoccus homiensis]